MIALSSFALVLAAAADYGEGVFRPGTFVRRCEPICFDAYVIEVLMRDLVAHDRQPSAFLVYLFLSARSESGRESVSVSLREIAEDTGLSKSAVQVAIRHLMRRELIAASAAHRTATPTYRVFQPWRRLRRNVKARPSPSAKVRGPKS